MYIYIYIYIYILTDNCVNKIKTFIITPVPIVIVTFKRCVRL